MVHLVLLGSVCLAVVAAQFTVPDSYTHMISFMTLKPKFQVPTTTQALNCSPGDSQHFDYMVKKYERDFGSRIESDDFTYPTTEATSPGQTFSTRIITVTEFVDNPVDETYVPDHTILQLIKELGDKGLRVMSKLQTINQEQNKEHFPWKYLTEHKEYREARTKAPSSPATFENAEAKAAYKKKAERKVLDELVKELRDAMEIGEQKKKEILKKNTPSSAENKQMREYYEQTKQWCENVKMEFTTWDGGERHVTLTPDSVEREVLPHETFKKYDTLELYHEQKAKEAEQFDDDDDNEGETELNKSTKESTPTTTESLNGTVTVSWDVMSKVMWHYIKEVTQPKDDKSNTDAPDAFHKNMTTGRPQTLKQVTITTEEDNPMLQDYLKYLTEIGETIEPPTTSFLVERFPRRLSSEEIAKRKLYSKNPNFKEKFARRLDSVEMEKRRSRLSTPPTTGTWAYSTFKRDRTYSSHEKQGIREFFLLNNISTDGDYFGETSQHSKSFLLNNITSEHTQQPESQGDTCYTKNSHHTTEQYTKNADDIDSKYKHIDVPIIPDNMENTLTSHIENINSETLIKTAKTMSYSELSSVMLYYVDLLRIQNGTKLFLETTAPVIRITPSPMTPVTLATTDRKHIATAPSPVEGFSQEDARVMTEAPMQHVFNLLFDPFRHDVAPTTDGKAQGDNFDALLKSLASTVYTETYYNSTGEWDHQIAYTDPITTPKVYSKGDVYAMGHRTYRHGSHDPMWRSKYGGYKASTTPDKKKLMNVFDDPLGLYMRPDTEEEKKEQAKLAEEEKEREARAKFDNVTIYPYWRALNQKYFASTVTIFPGQYTPRNENHTRVTEKTLELLLSEENYIERRATTAPREWTGYQLETTTEYEHIHDPFPDPEEIARQMGKSEKDPLGPDHILEKRIQDRDLEDQMKINEDDMPGSSYMNLSFSDQLCVDRAPALQLFDESNQFESEGFKTIEGTDSKTYDLMEKQILDEIEETRNRIAERKLNMTRQKEEQIRRMRSTTTPVSIEKKRLRMDHINFHHLDDQYQQEDMQDFKQKLKEQFGVIYERASTTRRNVETSSTQPHENTLNIRVITDKDGKVLRRIKKIKRRKTTRNTFLNENNLTSNNKFHHEENQNQTKKYHEEEHLNQRRIRRSASHGENHFGNIDTERKSTDINTEASTKHFETTQFTLPTTVFFVPPSGDPKYWDTLERKFHAGKSIHMDDVKDEVVIPSLEKMIEMMTANLTEADLNKTITEEEREIDSVSERYHNNFAGDIPGYDRDYDGNLVPTKSPAEIQKAMDEFEKERIVFMRKARGEYNRYLSQETYDQMKDQREVRIKHIEEYLDWNYQQEHEKEQERRRRRKYTSTGSTPLGKNITFENKTFTVNKSSTLAGSKILLSDEATHATENKTVIIENTLFTNKVDDYKTSIRSMKTMNQTKGDYYKTSIHSMKTINQTKGNIPLSTVSQNTLVAQVLEYKRFMAQRKTRKYTKSKDFTISDLKFNKTKTSTTESPAYSYEDYNISTTVDVLDKLVHDHKRDHFDHLTNVPLAMFEGMKQSEDNLYKRYHNGEISFDEFVRIRDLLIEKYVAYTKSTTQYTHPSFNITVSKFPDVGEIENHADLRKAWKKVEDFERRMINNTLYQQDFSLFLTKIPTIPPRRPRTRNKRLANDLQFPPRNGLKRVRKSIIELENPSLLLNMRAVTKMKASPNVATSRTTINVSETCSTVKKQSSKVKIIKKSDARRSLKQSRNSGTKASRKSSSSPNSFKSKISKTNIFNSKREIKGIQKQLVQLKEELDMIRTNLCSGREENERDDTFENSTSKSIISPTTPGFHVRPYLYRRSGKSARLTKYELKMKPVSFEDEDEKRHIKLKFIERDQYEDSSEMEAERDFLVDWRKVTINEDAGDSLVEETRDYEAELGTVHPHTLVTMVSDLYHQRMSLQNHIQYETTTLPADTNRTYLYQVFGFNTRMPRRVTRNTSAQVSLFRHHRSTIQHNYRRVSNIQYVLERYTKNLTVFSKNEKRLWDVFFYEKNIPQAKHPNGQVRWKVEYCKGDRAVRVPQEVVYEYEYESVSDYSDHDDKEDGSQVHKPKGNEEQMEFQKFIRERKCIRTTDRPMKFAFQWKISLQLPTEKHQPLMNSDHTATHFFFEKCEPP